MATKPCQPSRYPNTDTGTDCALIAASFGAALLALVYLILI
jgi:hypothetical protein